MSHRRDLLATLLASVVVSGAGAAAAVTIDLGTDGVTGHQGNAGGYTVTAAGAVNQTPYNVGPVTLGLSSDGFNSGTPVAGATPANFDGLAIFSTTFVLPANASGATLSYDGLSADDRFALELNGHVLETSGIYAASTPQAGNFVFTHGGPKTPVTYAGSVGGTNGSVTGVDTAFFNLGGSNTLSILVNATYSGIYDSGTPNGLYSGDFKDTSFGAQSISVTYSSVSSAPEPATWALMIVGFGGLGAALRRSRRRMALS